MSPIMITYFKQTSSALNALSWTRTLSTFTIEDKIRLKAFKKLGDIFSGILKSNCSFVIKAQYKVFDGKLSQMEKLK